MSFLHRERSETLRQRPKKKNSLKISIKSFMIDDVSESLGNTFDKLLDLRFS